MQGLSTLNVALKDLPTRCLIARAHNLCDKYFWNDVRQRLNDTIDYWWRNLDRKQRMCDIYARTLLSGFLRQVL